MKRSIQQPLSASMVLVVFSVFSAQQVKANEHVLPLQELQGQLRSAAGDRAKNIEDIQRVLSYPAAAAALEKSNVSLPQMRAAVATLDDAELTRLSEKARASEKDVEGGIIVGLLALIGLIVVILIVVAVVAEARPPQAETVPSA
jgi:hypothetical protein